MSTATGGNWTAFIGMERAAAGPLLEVVAAIQPRVAAGGPHLAQVFDDATGAEVEIDWRGSAADVLSRIDLAALAGEEPASRGAATQQRGPGRPKLGVVAREVTLLPRHWAWLNEQPGGASVALRKLVDAARHEFEGADRVRKAREAAYRFASRVAGDLPGFEEANRALFAGDAAGFDRETRGWPADVRDYARTLASASFVSMDAP